MLLGPFSFCTRETRRLLWIVGTMFAVLVVLRRLHPLSSVFSAKKVPVEGNTGFQAGDPPSNVDMVGNVSASNDLNYTATYASNEIANTSASSFVSEESGGLDRTIDIGVHNISVQSNGTLEEKDRTTSSDEKTKNFEYTDLNRTRNSSPVTRVPEVNKGSGVPSPMMEVYTISDMNKLLHHSRTSYDSVVCLKSSSFMLFSL